MSGYAVTPGLDASILSANLAPFKAKFVSDETLVIANTSVETSILGNGKGSLLVSANTIAPGTAIELWVRGTYRTKLLTPGNIIFRVKSGGSVLAIATLVNLPANVSSAGFEIEGHTIIRTIGASGTTQANGVVNYAGIGSVKLADDFIDQAATINTTVDRQIEITAQWQTADPNNVLNVTQVVLKTIVPSAA